MADGFRIAFCIECHKYTPVLQELCRQLQHPEADIFIHVDAKSDIGDFAPLRPLARFIHPRSKVYWGEYGQIDCMLKLLRATCNGDYRYIAILSGDTLPLRPCGQIHDFLEACYPRQFADMQPELHITELTQKMQWCHYPDRNDWIGRLPGCFPAACSLWRIGSAKAAVLPVPVWAQPSRSRPRRPGGMARC